MKRQKRRHRKHRSSGVSPRAQEAAQRHYAMGEEALDSQDVETAMHQFSLALKQDPYLDTAYFGMGTAYAMSEELDEAYQYLKHATQLNPGEAVYYHNLGNTCLQLRRISEAYNCYQQYIKLAPDGDQAVDISTKLRLIEKGIRMPKSEKANLASKRF